MESVPDRNDAATDTGAAPQTNGIGPAPDGPDVVGIPEERLLLPGDKPGRALPDLQ